jgi:hypothetical protein
MNSFEGCVSYFTLVGAFVRELSALGHKQKFRSANVMFAHNN